MEIWQEIKKDKEKGARRLVAEYGNRIYAADENAAKEKVSPWLLIGFFKECFKRNRTNKRKDEY